MQVTVSFREVAKTIDLATFQQGVTLGELVTEVLGVHPPQRIYLDSASVPADTPLSDAGLVHGMVISDQPTPRLPTADWTIRVSAGMDVGYPVPIPPGEPFTVGRSPQVDLTLTAPSTSWVHASFAIRSSGLEVKDLGSSNGTFVGEQRIDQGGFVISGDEPVTVVIGGNAVVVERGSREVPVPASRITPTHTIPFNRPPRPGLLGNPPEIEAPTRERDQDPPKFSWAIVLSPILMAIVMVILLGSMRYALFALLSPIMAIGSWLEQKRRSKKSHLEHDEAYAKDLEIFRSDLKASADLERQRRGELAPDPGLALIRAAMPATSLWLRRYGAADFHRFNVGIGHVPWTPPLSSSKNNLADEPKELVESATIANAPVDVDLSNAGVVGIYGEREAALGLARSLIIQAATSTGPADLSIGIFADREYAETWEWAGWLPHTTLHQGGTSHLWLGFARKRSEQILANLKESIDSLPTNSFLLVIDSDQLLEGRESDARDLLSHGRYNQGHRTNERQIPVSGIVIADTAEKLPASCTTTIYADDAATQVFIPSERLSLTDVLLAKVSIADATQTARYLAHFEDPEVKVQGAALPNKTGLLQLLDLATPTGEAVSHRWRTRRGFSAPVGVSEEGSYSLDLVQDGPHGLVGGTTGSGKSEFLRTYVAGLAASVDPEHLNFILIDFKGGAAFAACNDLPHTIGTISNLEEQLADRAIRALEAEMRFRQEMFALAGEGVDNIDAYWATSPSEPMPRILLVVDEFAQMAKEMPDALASLVSVAAVGRTLGIHMILATQRPAGVVNDDILANTNMRVALRVQSREDSSNVIGVPDASTISREQRGRAYVKLGQDDISPIQTALVTGYSDVEETGEIEFTEVFFGEPPVVKTPPRPLPGAENDLDKLIAAVKSANESIGYSRPRRVWPEALGERVNLATSAMPDATSATQDPSQATQADVVPTVCDLGDSQLIVGLADDPDHQCQVPTGWDLDEGNLLLLGIPGSGTTTTLKSIALAATLRWSPDELEIYVFDLGARGLASLEQLPHVNGYAGSGPGSAELQTRTLRQLLKELKERQSYVTPAKKRILVLFDGFAAFREDHQDTAGMELLEAFYRIYADGPDVGIHTAVTSSRSKSVPGQIDDVTTQKWLFRLADSYDYTALGIKREQIPAPLPGRMIATDAGMHTHIATPPQGFDEAFAEVCQRFAGVEKSRKIQLLPERVWAHDIWQSAVIDTEPLVVPVGIADADLEPFGIELYPGEHILIAGPVRSGKSSVLLGIADALARKAESTGQPLTSFGIGSPRSPLRGAHLTQYANIGDHAEILVAARVHQGPALLLIDDAERLEDTQSLITDLIQNPPPNLLIIAAGRADDLRTNYGHWSKALRRSRAGILLNPNIDFDGELLGVRLPRRTSVPMTTGRGYACSGGVAHLIQAVTAEVDPS